MFAVIGVEEKVYQERMGESFISQYEDVEFNSESDAESYIERSRLAVRRRVSYGSDIVFRSSSLLRNCISVEISSVLNPSL